MAMLIWSITLQLIRRVVQARPEQHPPAGRLVDDGLFKLSDLRKTSRAAVKELHGMGPDGDPHSH